MTNSKTPRPARRKWRSHFRAASSFVRHHESSIAAFSVLLSSVGLLIAAVSAWTAWQQVQIISRDRQTPFRAVLLDQQLSAMNAALEDMARFQLATICAESISVNHLASDIEARRACVGQVSEALNQLELSIKRSIALWPEQSNAAPRNFLVEAAKQNACTSQVLLYGQSGLQSGERMITCGTDLGRERDRLLALEMAARQAMGADLRKTSALE